MAIVDFVSVRNWSYEDYLKQNQETTLNKPWSPGYYVWEIKNVRTLKNLFLVWRGKVFIQ